MADFQKLRNALAWAKEEQDRQFSMRSWVAKKDKDYDHYPTYEEMVNNPCGTMMCLAGNIVFSEGKEEYQKAVMTNTFDATAVRIVLGHDPRTEEEVMFSRELRHYVFYESEYNYDDVEETLNKVMAKYAHLERPS